MTSRFLFCPLASPGHVFPMVGISLELTRRGHSVAFATSARFGDLLHSQGIRRIPRRPRDGESFQLETWWNPTSIALQSAHILQAASEFQPDVLIGGQLAYGPMLMGEALDLPVAILGFATHLFPKPRRDAEQGDEKPDEAEERAAWRLDSMSKKLHEARKYLHLPPLSRKQAADFLLGDLFLLQSVPELEPASADLPPEVHCVGSCVWEPPTTDKDLTEWMKNTEELGPVVYMQHGRLFHLGSLWQAVTECLGGANLRLVASTGRTDAELMKPSPLNFFVRDHVPQGQVLPHATAVVSTANTTAVLGSLSFGLPLILLPGGGEQLEMAAICKRIGAALTLDPEGVTPESLHAALREIGVNPRFRASAMHIQSYLSKVQGHLRAADLLESLAEGAAVSKRSVTSGLSRA
ncbi:nucleotide disphospho-sugar-binding domain-containing protein [Nonomuraea sp. NPDC050202]|uniref:glycosyltransferase n=1 Tax=Nonomuraea sp. NPDC050202 TaxID=3155035 RepID=UPI0033CD09A8